MEPYILFFILLFMGNLCAKRIETAEPPEGRLD
jgi:hypothetical protein